jgi:hypothetical protein
METITAQIARGVFDKELAQMEEAIAQRLTIVRKSAKMADFGIGDKVKVNSYCGTQYLRGSTATVVGIRQKKLLIKLDAPVGRFVRTMADGTKESSDIVVPPSILDKI